MKDVWEEVGRWAARGDRIAIAMVVGAERSGPRPLGTKMAINDRGEIAGSRTFASLGGQGWLISTKMGLVPSETRARSTEARSTIRSEYGKTSKQVGLAGQMV